MFSVLSTRRLLFETSPERLVYLTKLYDFDGVDAVVPYFLDPDLRVRFVHLVREAGLRWGTAALPGAVGTTTGDEEFELLLHRMRALAPLLADAGVTTVSTWLAPANDEAEYEQALGLHRRRLDALTPVLAAADLRLALEYVGPTTWRAGYRHPFISDLGGMRSLIASLEDPGRFGLLLDTFHWYTAGEDAAHIRALRADEVLAVDLNDAPAGVPREEQLDMERAQPGATGVIDVRGFMDALRSIGYAGPVQSEPFSSRLRSQPEEQRVAEARRGLAASAL